MEMAPYKQDLERCFTEYENLQAQHIHTMENESMPDIAAMTRERDTAFMRLKQHLDDFVLASGAHENAESISELTEYQARLSSIMDTSEVLSKAIQVYKDKLKINLIKIRQGKAALQGYKTASMNY